MNNSKKLISNKFQKRLYSSHLGYRKMIKTMKNYLLLAKNKKGFCQVYLEILGVSTSENGGQTSNKIVITNPHY